MGTVMFEENNAAMINDYFQATGSFIDDVALGGWLNDANSEETTALLRTIEESCTALRRLDIEHLTLEGPSPFSSDLLRATQGRLHELFAGSVNARDI